MREELRRKLPKTGTCGALVAGGLALVLVAVAFVIWHFAVADTPSRMVQVVMGASRDGDVAAVKAYLTPESLQSPTCDLWLTQLMTVLGKRNAVLKSADILDDRATVHVLVAHRAASAEAGQTDVGLEVVRTEEGWLLDLERTMASATPQFWTTIMAESP